MSEIAASRAASSAMLAHLAAAATTRSKVAMATAMIETDVIQLRAGCVNASALQLLEAAYACQQCFAPLRINPNLLRIDAVIGQVRNASAVGRGDLFLTGLFFLRKG